MKTLTAIAMAATSLLVFACCSSSREAQTAGNETAAATASVDNKLNTVNLPGNNDYRGQAPRGTNGVMPKAVLYKTNGDYRLNVPISVTREGDGYRLLSYPAPTDISTDMEPVVMADGWLLDRRGVGRNTVFTTYTYESYSALDAAPSTETLIRSIIPGSCVTESKVLPMTLGEALADTAAVNTMIRMGKF